LLKAELIKLENLDLEIDKMQVRGDLYERKRAEKRELIFNLGKLTELICEL